MRYCPICGLERLLYRLYGKIWYWWHYKILKEPQPDATETIMGMIPVMMSAIIGMEIAGELSDCVDDEIKDYRKNKKRDVKK